MKGPGPAAGKRIGKAPGGPIGYLQIARFSRTQDVTENIPLIEAKTALDELLALPFAQIHVQTNGEDPNGRVRPSMRGKSPSSGGSSPCGWRRAAPATGARGGTTLFEETGVTVPAVLKAGGLGLSRAWPGTSESPARGPGRGFLLPRLVAPLHAGTGSRAALPLRAVDLLDHGGVAGHQRPRPRAGHGLALEGG